MAKDQMEVVGLVRDLAYRQLDAQISSSDNYDSKAVGVLAFDGAALAAVLAVKDAFHGSWWIPELAIVVSITYAIVAIRSRYYDSGPKVKGLYGKVRRSSPVDANARLVTELIESIAANRKVLEAKSHYFVGSLVATAVGGISSAILLWFFS
jgi:hypothetical protein